MDNLVKLVSRMFLPQDEEYHIPNHPMVEGPLKSDQAGFEAAVGKEGNEIMNKDPQKDKKGGTLVDLGKRRKKLTEKEGSFKLSTLESKRNRMNFRLLRQP